MSDVTRAALRAVEKAGWWERWDVRWAARRGIVAAGHWGNHRAEQKGAPLAVMKAASWDAIAAAQTVEKKGFELAGWMGVSWAVRSAALMAGQWGGSWAAQMAGRWESEMWD